MVDEATRRQQAEVERCALLELLLVLSQRPGQRMPAAQLRRLAAALHARLFVAPRRPRPAGRGEGDASQYAVDLVRKGPGKLCDPSLSPGHKGIRTTSAGAADHLKSAACAISHATRSQTTPARRVPHDASRCDVSSVQVTRTGPQYMQHADMLRSGGAAGAPGPGAGRPVGGAGVRRLPVRLPAPAASHGGAHSPTCCALLRTAVSRPTCSSIVTIIASLAFTLASRFLFPPPVASLALNQSGCLGAVGVSHTACLRNAPPCGPDSAVRTAWSSTWSCGPGRRTLLRRTRRWRWPGLRLPRSRSR